MGRVATLGQMVEAMKVLTLMTRKKVWESIFGLMAENMMVNGSMGNSMVRVDLLILRARANEVSGRMERKSGGSKQERKALAFQLRLLTLERDPLSHLKIIEPALRPRMYNCEVFIILNLLIPS